MNSACPPRCEGQRRPRKADRGRKRTTVHHLDDVEELVRAGLEGGEHHVLVGVRSVVDRLALVKARGVSASSPRWGGPRTAKGTNVGEDPDDDIVLGLNELVRLAKLWRVKEKRSAPLPTIAEVHPKGS